MNQNHNHNHSAHHHHPHNHTSANITLAFFLNLGFTVVEIVGGIMTNSLAIMSDALHDLGDSFSLGLSWYLEHKSHKTGDRKYSYGYRRFSLLGALVNSVFLVGGALFIISKAIPRIIHPQSTDPHGMVALAVVGVLVNGIAALRLRRDKSLNSRAIALHLLEDVLGWAAVLVMSVVLLFKPWYILDPILSLAITVFVLFNVARNLPRILKIFLQAIPDDVDTHEIDTAILDVDKVCSVHNTHVWSLDGDYHVMTTHVIVDPSCTREDTERVKDRVRGIAQEKGFGHITVDIEYGESRCVMRKTESHSG